MSRSPSGPLPPAPLSAAERLFAALERFLHVEAASGIVLMLAAAIALAWSNSPFADAYQHLWHANVTIGYGAYAFREPLHFWINDALMTVFFLVVGMEIRREMHDGALASVPLAALPVAAALGGVAVPALIYLGINGDDAVARAGWAVSSATDIAFAVGVLALLGKSVPSSLRIFLLAIAIIDDIAAVIVIAVLYSQGLDASGFAIAGGGVLLVLGLQRLGVGAAWAYVVPGAVVWFGALRAGVHPTLAGVALGLLTPVAALNAADVAPVERVEKALHPWVAYGVMPLFALANAGVPLAGLDLSGRASWTVLVGVCAALVVGKPIGIFAASWIAVRAGACRLPSGVTWRGVLLVGLLGGIGFTMSIFIATLAFGDSALLAAAKLGVLVASVTAGVLGLVYGKVFKPV